MTTTVVDASLFGPLIIPDEEHDMHPDLMDVLVAGNAVVPQHWSLEIANLGVVALRRKRVTRDRLVAGVAIVNSFAIEVDAGTSASALGRTLDLATEHGLTSYDAAYLELALRRGLSLFTNDGKLKAAAEASGASLVA